jgi:hypothetical protein
MKDYKTLYTKFSAFEAAKKENSGKTPANMSNPYTNLGRDFLSSLTTDLSFIKLIRNDDGLVSAKETFAGILDEQYAKAAYIAFDMPRSSLMKGNAAQNAKYATLTPLLLFAHKHYHKVQYEEWDKKDTNIIHALGRQFAPLFKQENLEQDWEAIYKVLTLEKVSELRELYVGNRKATGWMGSKTEFEYGGEGHFTLLSGSIIAKMLLQCWIAHPSIRVPGAMILNPHNWDAIPEAFDLSVESSDFRQEKSWEDNLPF